MPTRLFAEPPTPQFTLNGPSANTAGPRSTSGLPGFASFYLTRNNVTTTALQAAEMEIAIRHFYQRDPNYNLVQCKECRMTLLTTLPADAYLHMRDKHAGLLAKLSPQWAADFTPAESWDTAISMAFSTMRIGIGGDRRTRKYLKTMQVHTYTTPIAYPFVAPAPLPMRAAICRFCSSVIRGSGSLRLHVFNVHNDKYTPGSSDASLKSGDAIAQTIGTALHVRIADSDTITLGVPKRPGRPSKYPPVDEAMTVAGTVAVHVGAGSRAAPALVLPPAPALAVAHAPVVPIASAPTPPIAPAAAPAPALAPAMVMATVTKVDEAPQVVQVPQAAPKKRAYPPAKMKPVVAVNGAPRKRGHPRKHPLPSAMKRENNDDMIVDSPVTAAAAAAPAVAIPVAAVAPTIATAVPVAAPIVAKVAPPPPSVASSDSSSSVDDSADESYNSVFNDSYDSMEEDAVAGDMEEPKRNSRHRPTTAQKRTRRPRSGRTTVATPTPPPPPPPRSASDVLTEIKQLPNSGDLCLTVGLLDVADEMLADLHEAKASTPPTAAKATTTTTTATTTTTTTATAVATTVVTSTTASPEPVVIPTPISTPNATETAATEKKGADETPCIRPITPEAFTALRLLPPTAPIHYFMLAISFPHTLGNLPTKLAVDRFVTREMERVVRAGELPDAVILTYFSLKYPPAAPYLNQAMINAIRTPKTVVELD